MSFWLRFMKYWALGIAIICVLFLTLTSPTDWHAYFDTLLNTPILISIRQSAYLLLGGMVLGTSLLLGVEAFK